MVEAPLTLPGFFFIVFQRFFNALEVKPMVVGKNLVLCCNDSKFCMNGNLIHRNMASLEPFACDEAVDLGEGNGGMYKPQCNNCDEL